MKEIGTKQETQVLCYAGDATVVEQTNEGDDINKKNNKRLAEEEQGRQENV